VAEVLPYLLYFAMTSHDHNMHKSMQCTYNPNSVLELQCVLCHPSFPTGLGTTARLLASSKAVAAAATAARTGQLQELRLNITSSSNARQVAAWTTKNPALLQGVRTLQLQVERTAIDDYSRAASSNVWDMLIHKFTYSTKAATGAAAILQAMPRTLNKVNLQLQGEYDGLAIPLQYRECTLLRAELAALPNLHSISIAGPGAAACLPCSSSLAATFSHLTSLRLGTIRSAFDVQQLLRGLPASLQHLRLDVDTAWPTMGLNVWAYYQQSSVQLAHLTALTTLHVTGRQSSFIIGEDSVLPPNLVNLTATIALSAQPLLPLTNLQHLNIRNLRNLKPAEFPAMARCLTQLTHMETGTLIIDDDDAPDTFAALDALHIKSLGVMSYGPHVAGHNAGGPAVAGRLLGELTALNSLTILLGSYVIAEVASSLAQLTGLQQLELTIGDSEKQPRLFGDRADCENFVDTIAGMDQLRHLTAAGWFVYGGDVDSDVPHPIMRLQAATQLTFLDLECLSSYAGKQTPDWATLLKSLPGVKLGRELAGKSSELAYNMVLDMCADDDDDDDDADDEDGDVEDDVDGDDDDS
jgi:hypothetical protein